MGRIPDLKRIAKEDFAPEYQDLVGQLAFPLNSHMEQVRSLFNKNIDSENLAQEFITLSFTTNGNSQPLSLLTYRSNLRNRIRGLIPISLTILSNNTSFPTQAPFISFSQNGNIVTINNIAGLQPEIRYEITFLALS